MTNLEIVNLIQKDTAIIALGLLAVQIFTNSSKKLYLFLTYLFIFVQPFLVLYSRYMFRGSKDPFYMFIDLCVLCDGKAEYYINFLRITFYAISIYVFTPYFKLPKIYHQISKYFVYVGFYSLSAYLYFVVLSLIVPIQNYYFWICQVLVLVSVVKEIKEVFKPKFKL